MNESMVIKKEQFYLHLIYSLSPGEQLKHSVGTMSEISEITSSHPTTSVYLVLQVFRLLLLVVALVHAPDKVMEVVLVELLTVVLTHGPQDLTDGHLGHQLTQL